MKSWSGNVNSRIENYGIIPARERGEEGKLEGSSVSKGWVAWVTILKASPRSPREADLQISFSSSVPKLSLWKQLCLVFLFSANFFSTTWIKMQQRVYVFHIIRTEKKNWPHLPLSGCDYWSTELKRKKKICVSDRILHTFFYICFYCDRNCHLPKYFLYKCPQISKTVQYVPPTSVTDGRDIWNCKMPVWRAESSNVVVLPQDNIVFSTPGRFWKINQFLLSSPMFMALVLLLFKSLRALSMSFGPKALYVEC